MTDWYKIKKVLIWQGWEEKQIYPAQTVQTFDFQNNGALWWTWITIYGTPTYTSWQWWTIVTSTSQQSAIMPPSSVYNWQKLVKYKLRMYKSIASTSSKSAWCGMSASRHSNWLVCCNQLVNSVVWANVYNGSSDTFTQTTDIVWEATLEYYLNDDWSLELSINWWTKYNLWNFATLFRTDWQNNNLWICIWAWSLNSAFSFYVRKVEITTKP